MAYRETKKARLRKVTTKKIKKRTHHWTKKASSLLLTKRPKLGAILWTIRYSLQELQRSLKKFNQVSCIVVAWTIKTKRKNQRIWKQKTVLSIPKDTKSAMHSKFNTLALHNKLGLSAVPLSRKHHPLTCPSFWMAVTRVLVEIHQTLLLQAPLTNCPLVYMAQASPSITVHKASWAWVISIQNITEATRIRVARSSSVRCLFPKRVQTKTANRMMAKPWTMISEKSRRLLTKSLLK